VKPAWKGEVAVGSREGTGLDGLGIAYFFFIERGFKSKVATVRDGWRAAVRHEGEAEGLVLREGNMRGLGTR
jgi:hypothetical protein